MAKQSHAKKQFESMTADLPPESQLPDAPPEDVVGMLVDLAAPDRRAGRDDFQPHWPERACIEAKIGGVTIGPKKGTLTVTMKDSEGYPDLPHGIPIATTSASENGTLTIRYNSDERKFIGVTMTYHHNRVTGVVRAKFTREAGWDMEELRYLNSYKKLQEGERLEAYWDPGATMFDGESGGDAEEGDDE